MTRTRGALLTALACAAALAASSPVRAGVEPAKPALDRKTPRRSLRTFLFSARKGDDAAAARCLSLYQIPEEERASEGPRLARELQIVLDHALWIEWEKVSDKPEGDDKTGTVVLGSIPANGDHLPIVLVRTLERDGTEVWLFSEATVERIPTLWSVHGAGWIGDWLPPVLLRTRFLDAAAWQWIALGCALVLAYALGRLFSFAALGAGGWAYRHARGGDSSAVVQSVRTPLRWAITAALFGWLARQIALPSPIQNRVDEAWSVVFVLALAWLAVRAVDTGASVLQARVTADVADESRRRGLRTQVAILRRVATMAAMLIAIALVLTRFQTVRNVGMSLLASAGIAGIVLGLAAQRSIGALLGGLQLSLTQPIRIDDTVVVGGEWGWVEEIHLTYVVIKLRDRRRLVVPVNKFLDEPFQNWTRTSPEVTGTFALDIARDVSVPEIRAELERLCRANPLWDGRTARIQMTALGADEATLEVMVSSSDAAKNWDLRCELREKLLEFIRAREDRKKAA